MSAAETGHLVLSTLHTIDAGQTINRILGMFDSGGTGTDGPVSLTRCAGLSANGSLRSAADDIPCWKSQTCASVKRFAWVKAKAKSFYEIIEANYAFGWKTLITRRSKRTSKARSPKKPPHSIVRNAARSPAALITCAKPAAK